MSDRGDYRSLYCAFWDDADVHAMSDNAYRVLTTIKGTLTAAGIGIVYLSQLADRCGKTPDQLEAAFVELERPKPDAEYGWVVRERNVVWIVNGLRFEPTLFANNPLHRTFLRKRLLAPLGERAIVAAFKRYYADWFNGADPIPDTDSSDDTPSEPSRNGLERVSKPSPIQSSPFQPEPLHPKAADDCASAQSIAVWSNTAVTERWGEQPSPYTAAAAQGAAHAFRKLGIEAGAVRLSIYRQCRESKQPKPPRGPGYFCQGVEEDWSAELARRAVVASGETPPSPEHTARPGKGRGSKPKPQAVVYPAGTQSEEDIKWAK